MSNNPAWDAISEADFTAWVLKALRRAGYLAAHVNAIALCPCCRAKRCPCGGRAIAKMEPGFPDVVAVSPLSQRHPLIIAELKTTKGRIATTRGSVGKGPNRRTLPSQLDWLTALASASLDLMAGPARAILGTLWTPASANTIQEALLQDYGVNREQEMFRVLDALEQSSED